jgi:glycosyltransferase involved in cell wall biosynthesis
MRVSVVIPSRDRPAALDACLTALAQQVDGPDEIVVVDDASVDVGAVVAIVGQRARLVRGAGRGPAAARNLGARHATGDLVLFTDDDCRPEPGWSGALRRRAEAGAEVVAGPTVVGDGAGPPARAAQVVTNHLVEASLADGVVAFAPTSNLAVRAEVLAELPFDERYPLAAGEDRDWCERLAVAGRAIAYEPGAVVRHHPALDLAGFWRQQVRYGRGAHRFRAAGDRPRPPLAFYLDLLRKGFGQGPAAGGLVVLAQLATVVGWVREARQASA